MNRSPGAVLFVLAAFAACAGGCGSSPPSTYYALSPANGSAQPSLVRTVKLRRPGIAGYLDRPEIVERVVDHRLRVADTERWASPLDEMLGRVLAQDVEQRLAGSVVFTEDGAITADADATVEIDVRELGVGEDGQVNLVAELAVEKGDSHVPAATRAIRLHGREKGASTSALVATMSDLVGQLADQVAELVAGRYPPPASSARSSSLSEASPAP
jgi:hypothetical protein